MSNFVNVGKVTSDKMNIQDDIPEIIITPPYLFRNLNPKW